MLDDPKYQSGDALTAVDVSGGTIISPDTRRAQRVPPGQARTRKWPVLHWGGVPSVPTSRWTLEIRGLVEHPLTLTWDDFQSLPRVKVFADFHCVTRWSRLGNIWEGVSTREILGRCGVQPEAQFALPMGYDDGWTTNLPLHYFLQEDALFADTHDGEPLSADHGGPVRLIIPQLYAWKSAKWVKAIELSAEDRPGLWEEGGYHDRGDPWLEERFRE
ncbi:MAG: sulfite oxidase-like oxidoreductase [Planctomycetaceae bacterium]